MSFSENLRSVDQVAIERGWSPKRIRSLIREGLPVVPIGRQRLVNLETLDRFLAAREAAVASGPLLEQRQ